MQPGRIFTAREVMGAIHRMSNGQMHIMDGTVTRYFREYNKKNGRKLVVVVGKPQDSKYMKLDPTEWVQGTFDQMEAGKRGAGMKFKQLEWTQDKGGDWSAYGFFGAFYVEDTGEQFEGSLADSNDYDDYEPGFFPAEQAKAYCQSLFEKQVAGAIPSSSTGRGRRAPRKWQTSRQTPIAMDLRGGGWSWYEHVPICTGGYWNDFRNGVVFAHHLPDVIEYKGDFLHSLTIPNGWKEGV